MRTSRQLTGWSLRGSALSHWLVQISFPAGGSGAVVPKCPCLTYSLGSRFPHQKRACLNFTYAWLWRSVLRINLSFCVLLARERSGLHSGGSPLPTPSRPHLSESPLAAEGLGTGQEDVPQHKRRGSQGHVPSHQLQVHPGWSGSPEGRRGTLVSFLEKS